MPLTPRPREMSAQLTLLRYVAGYLEATGGVAPTVRECGAALGWRSLSKVRDTLAALEEAGHLRRLSRRARAIELHRPVSIPRAPDGAPLYAVAPRQQAAG